jgi:predicted aldo/keto reductase-like oxidoreductase
MGATMNQNLIQKALGAGITFFDTAYYYGAGEHETILGNTFKGKPRDSFIIATKIQGPLDYKTGLAPPKTTAAEFKAEFRKKTEISLKRLQMEYVDILFVHGVKNSKLIEYEPLKEIMLKLKAEGKARFIGTSFHEQEVTLINTTAREKIYDVILTSYNFRQPHREEVKEAIAYAANAGLGVIAMKTQAGVYWDKERKQIINMKAALKWVLNNENVHTTIPGIGSFDQLETDLSIMEDLKLTPGEKKDLRLGEKTALVGLYCAQCGRCRSQCRYNLDIPTLMRSYMYAYGYQQPAKAKQTLAKINLRNKTCHTCASCTVQCTMAFDVKLKIKDIIRVLDIPDKFLI